MAFGVEVYGDMVCMECIGGKSNPRKYRKNTLYPGVGYFFLLQIIKPTSRLTNSENQKYNKNQAIYYRT